MAVELTRAPGFDDIVFKNRNKEYGAYSIRKKYHRTLLIGFIIGIVVLTAVIITPYFRASAQQRSARQKERRSSCCYGKS